LAYKKCKFSKLAFSMMDHDFLEPERLRAFVAVAETGSFTRAVERLHLTQPTVSVQVRRLEEYIGWPLFERNAQFDRLTVEGTAKGKREEGRGKREE
jgi:hypothetical protein